MRKNEKTAFQPDRIGAYFRLEWLPLTFVTMTGLIYNIGLLAGPWKTEPSVFREGNCF